MKFDIKPERYEEFKKFMAKKLTAETGRAYFPADIYVGQKDSNGNFKTICLTERSSFRYIFCDVDFKNYKRNALDDIEFIYGNVKFEQSGVVQLEDLQFIGGNADFSNSHIIDLGKLEYVGGDLYLQGCQVKDIDNLKYVGGKVLAGPFHRLQFDSKFYKKGKNLYFKNDPQYMKENNIVEDNESQI